MSFRKSKIFFLGGLLWLDEIFKLISRGQNAIESKKYEHIRNPREKMRLFRTPLFLIFFILKSTARPSRVSLSYYAHFPKHAHQNFSCCRGRISSTASKTAIYILSSINSEVERICLCLPASNCWKLDLVQ